MSCDDDVTSCQVMDLETPLKMSRLYFEKEICPQSADDDIRIIFKFLTN